MGQPLEEVTKELRQQKGVCRNVRTFLFATPYSSYERRISVFANNSKMYVLFANIATRGNESEKVEVIIPVKDRNLLKEIARKFGWACML